MTELTQARLKELVSYDPETGLFTWIAQRRGKQKINTIAGSNGPANYKQLKIDGVMYRAHRLVWFYVYGVWPKDQIDHINRIRNDNRLCNLREATNKENCQNTGARKNNKTGVKGIRLYGNKYIAQLRINDIYIHLGIFSSIESAIQVYEEAEIKFSKNFDYSVHSDYTLGLMSAGS